MWSGTDRVQEIVTRLPWLRRREFDRLCVRQSQCMTQRPLGQVEPRPGEYVCDSTGSQVTLALYEESRWPCGLYHEEQDSGNRGVMDPPTPCPVGRDLGIFPCIPGWP